MFRYAVKTLVDITRTNPDREEKDTVRLAQQSNFNSLVQGIGMRSNIEWDQDPVREEQDDTAIWHWEFAVERPDTFTKAGNPVALLIEDIHGIPIIKNLTNTDPLDKPVFITSGAEQNIWIEKS